LRQIWTLEKVTARRRQEKFALKKINFWPKDDLSAQGMMGYNNKGMGG